MNNIIGGFINILVGMGLYNKQEDELKEIYEERMKINVKKYTDIHKLNKDLKKGKLKDKYVWLDERLKNGRKTN